MVISCNNRFRYKQNTWQKRESLVFSYRSLQGHNIREITIRVYAKRRTSDSSWEFRLRIENKQIKSF